MVWSFRTGVFLASCCLIGAALAQQGVSSAAASRTRYLSELGTMPSSKEVAVEELINYHRHDIGRPKSGKAVLLDVRWGNEASAREGVLQIGLATALATDRQQLKPLNLALVIDKSGSMEEADKMSRVKAALMALVPQLRPVDTLSIVTFDSEADVLLPAQRVTNPEAIKSVIRGIQPGSATNLHGGLMLGYDQALKNYRKDATNRVILLTDGIANRGVTDPAEIARESSKFNDRGIDLSTIGVGLDLNKDLLRELAKSGRGLFHFVAESEDIEKVFVRELQSLVSPVAADPNLEIEWGSGLTLQKMFGYEPKLGTTSAKIKLDNMNSGITQVVMMRFAGSGVAKTPVKVRLTYYDLERKKQVVETEQAMVTLKPSGHGEMLADHEVAKNYTIAELAQSIHDMAAACEQKRYRQAENLLKGALDSANTRYPNMEDADVKRIYQIAWEYFVVLKQQNRFDADSDVETDATNLISNGNFSSGNVGFTSGLPYVIQSYNCLWDAGYTIARTWNQPLLHRLFYPGPYPSPERGGQVMYANASGVDSLLMWSSSVKCSPHTRYKISFRCISLNGGREWIPTYEIQVNGMHSDGQQAGYGDWASVSMTWNSGDSAQATISIVRLPMSHNGGLVGLAAIRMVKVDG